MLSEDLPPASIGASMQRLPSAVKRRNSRAVDMFTRSVSMHILYTFRCIFAFRRGSSTRQGGEGDEDCASITTIDPHVKQVSTLHSIITQHFKTGMIMLIDS